MNGLTRKQQILAAVLALVIIAATRTPLFENQLFSYDDVNLIYAKDELDVRRSQPHPPGYPLFVMQMRLVELARVKRPESNLQVLSILGSAAGVFALVAGFARVVGVRAAWISGLLLALHPVFWYAGLTSALRVQLALWSVVIAACCWRAKEEASGKWARIASIAFAVGSGVRPELGLVLGPLWLYSTFRHWRVALPVTCAGIGAWLIPLLISSGGPVAYVRVTLTYLDDQASLTSGLFGATGTEWQRAVIWMLTWCLMGAAALALPLAMGAASAARPLLRFVGLWTLPGLLFGATVHVADPGQTLAIVPAVCLLCGVVTAAAVDPLARLDWRAPVAFLIFAAPFAASQLKLAHPREIIVGVILCAAGAGALLRLPARWLPSTAMALSAGVLPALLVYAHVFFFDGWYWKGGILDDIHSALSYTSYHQFRKTIHTDHVAIDAVRKALNHTIPSIVVWERSGVSARKLAYYLPATPIFVYERKWLRADSAAVRTDVLGNRVLGRVEGPSAWTIETRPGTRTIAVLHPESPLRTLLGCRAHELPVCVRDHGP